MNSLESMAAELLETTPVEPRGRAGRYFLLLLLALLLCGIWWQLLPRVLPILNVQVEGPFVNVKQDRLQALSANIVRGGFFTVNVDMLRERLLAEPWVASVTVRRAWPDTLILHVQEQVPVGVWNGDGLLNAQGEIFLRPAASVPRTLPALSGPEGMHRDLLDKFMLLNSALQIHDFQLTDLRRDARRSVSFTLDNGTVVKLGNQDVETRMSRFVHYVAPLLADEGTRHNRSIDMRYTNGFAIGKSVAANTARTNRGRP